MSSFICPSCGSCYALKVAPPIGCNCVEVHCPGCNADQWISERDLYTPEPTDPRERIWKAAEDASRRVPAWVAAGCPRIVKRDGMPVEVSRDVMVPWSWLYASRVNIAWTDCVVWLEAGVQEAAEEAAERAERNAERCLREPL